MKYKVGDRVIIKENKEHASSIINYFLENDRIMTIQEIRHNNYYIFKELGHTWYWDDNHIEGLAPELEIETTRFELMEL